MAASRTSLAAGQMSTPVPSPSMNGMIGSSGTSSVPSTIVMFSAIGLLLAPGGSASVRQRDDRQGDEIDREEPAASPPQRGFGIRTGTAVDTGQRPATLGASSGLPRHRIRAERALRLRRRARFAAHPPAFLSAASTMLRNSMAIVVG